MVLFLSCLVGFLRVPSVDGLVFVLSKKYNFAKLASYIQSLLVCTILVKV